MSYSISELQSNYQQNLVHLISVGQKFDKRPISSAIMKEPFNFENKEVE